MKRNYLSVSALKAFAKSPNHYIQYCTEPRTQSKAMAFGSAVHTSILEPEELQNRYAILPEVNRRTKAGKEAVEQFTNLNEGKEILDQKDWERMISIREAVSRHPVAARLLREKLAAEQTREVMVHGYPFKGIADIVGPDWVADLKTCQDASPAAFQRAAASMGYHLQGAAYREMWKVPRFLWIAVETAAPWNVAVYEQSREAAEQSSEKLGRLVNDFMKWDGQPMSYFQGVQELHLPYWAV